MLKPTPISAHLQSELDYYLINRYKRKLKRQLLYTYIDDTEYLGIAITALGKAIIFSCADPQARITLKNGQNDSIIMQNVIPCPTINRHLFSNNDSVAYNILAQLSDSIRIGEMLKLVSVLNQDANSCYQDLRQLLIDYLLKNWLIILQNFTTSDLQMLLDQFTKYLVDHWQQVEPDLKVNKNQSLKYLLQFYAKCLASPEDDYVKVLIGNLYQVAFEYLRNHFTDHDFDANRLIRNITNLLITINHHYGNGIDKSTNQQVTLSFPIDYFIYVMNIDELANGAKLKFIITSKKALGRFIDDLCLNFEKTDSRFDVIKKINKMDISFDYQQYAKDIMTYIDLFYQIKQTDYQTIYVILTYLFSDLEKE